MADEVALSLSAPESRLLERLRTLPPGSSLTDADLATATQLAPEVVRGCLERLRAKKLVLVEEKHSSRVVLTERGKEAAERGLPERRLWDALASGPLPASEARERSGLDEQNFTVAIGQLKRAGLLSMGEHLARGGSVPEGGLAEEVALRGLAQVPPVPEAPKEVSDRLVRRGLATLEHETSRSWSASPEGRSIALVPEGTEAIGALTSALLRGGSWQSAVFRPYDVRAPVPYVSGARTHAYLAWLREFEEVLIGLGFEESGGPLVENELYNSDALFIPQHHPARSAQDAFFLHGLTSKDPPQELLDRVAAAHEGRPIPGERRLSDGWGAKYDPAIAKRAVLRSHNTPVSVRYLLGRPKPPFRMYCIAPAFRRDAVDARHHIQFEQCEGVFGAEGVSLRDLVGLFQRMAKALGVGEVRLKPTYFPFTEPSIEGYVHHPKLGWIEVFPGGLFRPEVLRPLGVDVPVAAWGIGIMRLALVALGVDDIRELFSNDLRSLGEARL